MLLLPIVYYSEVWLKHLFVNCVQVLFLLLFVSWFDCINFDTPWTLRFKEKRKLANGSDFRMLRSCPALIKERWLQNELCNSSRHNFELFIAHCSHIYLTQKPELQFSRWKLALQNLQQEDRLKRLLNVGDRRYFWASLSLQLSYRSGLNLSSNSTTESKICEIQDGVNNSCY